MMLSAFTLSTAMYDYLHGSLLYVVDVLYIITFIVALLNFRKYNHTALRYLPFLLLFTIVFEFFGKHVAEAMPEPANNSLIYNIYHIFAFSFYYVLIRAYLLNARYKKWITFFLIGFLITSLVNPFFQNFLNTTQIFSYVLGSIFLVLSVFLFYLDVLASRKTYIIKYEPLFWIATGLLLFHVGYIPIKVIRVTYDVRINDEMMWIMAICHLILLISMYLCYNIGFIWARRN